MKDWKVEPSVSDQKEATEVKIKKKIKKEVKKEVKAPVYKKRQHWCFRLDGVLHKFSTETEAIEQWEKLNG